MSFLDYTPLLPLPLAFIGASFVLVLMALGGYLRYRTAFNPLVLFVFFEGLFMTLLSAWIAVSANLSTVEDVSKTLIVSTVYFVGISIVFLPIRVLGLRARVRRFFIRSKLLLHGPILGRIYHLLFVIIAFVLVFLTLMFASGAGLLWITNPRSAYQGYRVGSGYLFVMVQWILASGFLIHLFGGPRTISSGFKGLSVYVIIAYFTGSKGAILAGFVLLATFANFYIRRIPLIWFLLANFLGIPLMLVLLVVQGVYGNVLEALLYFKDYVFTTALFLGRFDDFDFRYGAASLSDLWFYVPRALYPEKPFEYGTTLIHQMLFPGFAEVGHTPGILPWSLAYLDFGTLGVFVCGLVSGFVKRLSYEFFLDWPNSIFAFVVAMQIALFPIFIYSNLPLTIVIAFLLTRYASLRIIGFSG